MKLVRFGAAGQEKPGIIDAAGAVRDLSGHAKDFVGEGVSPTSIAAIAKIDPQSLPLAPAGARIGAPVGNVRNFIAVGLNYEDHAREAGLPIPKEPILFNKLGNCIVGPNDDVIMPRNSTKLDWEIEIGFVISRKLRYVKRADALDYVAGYVMGNDVSERNFQIERSGQWMKGKCFESSGPLGPWLVTPDEIKDVQNLEMFLDVNGQRKQTGNTKSMIFPIDELVSYISQFMVLEAGDVVITGTPPGVGLGHKPEPSFLKVGDVMRMGIQGLGEATQKVIACPE
jgi:2-keto-4-pentenoate hydratase/2-oxohepta-3-ene-1,7-dioic acid hydratase in catechol pathway